MPIYSACREKKRKTSHYDAAIEPEKKEELLHEGNGKPYVTDDGVHMKALLNFPSKCQQGPHRNQRYILQRVAGDDVLQVVREHDIEGCLEVQQDNDNSAAAFYVQFPYHQGILAGRLDNVAPKSHSRTTKVNTKERPCYFTAVCSKAYVNYGTWDGTIERLGGTKKKSETTTTFASLHFAEAGDEHASAKNPFYIDCIHSMEILKDQPDEREQYDASQQYLFPEGYRPLTKGCLNFTLFLKREDEYHDNSDGDQQSEKEEDSFATLCLIFRPETEEEKRKRATSRNNSASMIPPEILEEINKLPPSKHTRS